MTIDHCTVVCLVTWPLNESEAGGDLALIETPCFSYDNDAVLMLISRNLCCRLVSGQNDFNLG